MFQVTKEDFKNIHNSRVHLLHQVETLEGIIHPNLFKSISQELENLRKGLQNLYKQENEWFNNRNNYFSSIQNKNNFISTWSIYEVSDLNEKFPFEAVLVKYNSDDGPVEVNVEGNTWLDLWRAADKAIKESEDFHHTFIEKFSPKNNGVVVLYTGS